MNQEVTDRFPTDPATQRAIARTGSGPAADAFAKLREGMPLNHVLVACWRKPQFSNQHSRTVSAAAGLSYVVGGVLHGGCRDLRFFLVPKGQAPSSDPSYRNLFL